MSFRWCALAMAAVLLATTNASANPILDSIWPPGGQRGAEFELTLTGTLLKSTQEVLLYSPGVSVVSLDASGNNKIKVRVKADANCDLGQHALRVRTKSGISEVQTFFVGPFPGFDEQEPNNDVKKANLIALNVTVTGNVAKSDLDTFRVHVKKGQLIAVEVEGIRLGRTLFDPQVTVLDDAGKALAKADDTALFRQDPYLTILAPNDGDYYVQISDTAGARSEGGAYRMHVGSFPRPAVVFPAGGKVGDEIEAAFLGNAGGEIVRKVKLPTEFNRGFGLFAELNGIVCPSANPFRLSDCRSVREAEPNNSVLQATVAKDAAPVAFDGIISTPGDEDFFRFDARKGETYELQVYAMRLGSPLDPLLTLLANDGRVLVSDEDSHDHDCAIRFVAPADGPYVLKVSDQRRQGSPLYVYRAEVTLARPKLTTFLPQPERGSQERQVIVVPRGNRTTTYVGVRRAEFAGSVSLSAVDLPNGVTMHADPIEADKYLTPVMFEAAADAPLAGKLVELRGDANVGKAKIMGGFLQTIDLVAGPADTSYHSITVDRLAVAVVEELPFAIELVQPTAPLVQDGELKLKVIAKRQPGYTSAITVMLPFLPPWVETPSKVTIEEGKNEAFIPLKAAAEMPIRSWKMIAEARGPVDGGIAWASSAFVQLRTEAPYVKGAIKTLFAEVGQTLKVVIPLEHRVAFEGKAKAQLLRLPPRATSQSIEITAATKEIVFDVIVDKTSPIGLHSNLYCQLTIVQDGYELVHALGRPASFRIEAPGGVVLGPDGRPLSRLEILRQKEQQKKK